VNTQLRTARAALARLRNRMRGRRWPYVLLGQGRPDTTVPLPAGAAAELTPDNPRLQELRRRYAQVQGPLAQHTFWTDDYRRIDLDLAYFRGDNAFVWQQRRLGELCPKLQTYLAYIEDIDDRSLLPTLGEDGAFGCWTCEWPDRPRVSRDLLDSVNELCFLQRTWGLFDRRGFGVVDIGAGYGRLAHRMSEAVAGMGQYYCVDAVPESTFLCEYYMRYRGVAPRVSVVPLDEIDRLPVGEIDLAVSIHSFSEMRGAAIAEWMRTLTRLRVPALLVIPNDPEGLLSVEADGSRQPAEHHITAAGYELDVHEPIFLDADVRQRIGVEDQYFLYRHRLAASGA
jgi:hypothetical protein